ncbi:MAG TPA: GFA family protein [Polyangiaceae bacterium]|nr:GFA family protein [Polyangiaceae bacterium]
MAMRTYTGSCHCGAIRFEADLDLEEGSNRCNCSYCAKARTWFAFAKGPQAFRRLEGGSLSEYRWTPPGDLEPHLTFAFCSHCGIRTYAQGNLEHLGGIFHAISVPALDLTPEQFAAIPVRYINGRDRRYDEAPPYPEAI